MTGPSQVSQWPYLDAVLAAIPSCVFTRMIDSYTFSATIPEGNAAKDQGRSGVPIRASKHCLNRTTRARMSRQQRVAHQERKGRLPGGITRNLTQLSEALGRSPQ